MTFMLWLCAWQRVTKWNSCIYCCCGNDQEVLWSVAPQVPLLTVELSCGDCKFSLTRGSVNWKWFFVEIGYLAWGMFSFCVSLFSVNSRYRAVSWGLDICVEERNLKEISYMIIFIWFDQCVPIAFEIYMSFLLVSKKWSYKFPDL